MSGFRFCWVITKYKLVTKSIVLSLQGRANLTRYGLIYENTLGRYVNDYNEDAKPVIFNEHATAAFRYFHSNIEGHLQYEY